MAKSFLIALPVRNGGEHLRLCVQSILAQTHRQFELVVLDNASTDGSLEWLRQQTDPRLSVIASATSLSIEESWARIMSLPMRHEYMTLVGHDDLLDADFLETLSGLIDSQPDARLYHAHFRLIDAHGRTIRPCIPMPPIERAHEFLAARLAFRRDSFGTGYVFRSADYVEAGGIPLYRKLMCADDALWMTLTNGSIKATHVKECFSYRVHSGSTSFAPDWRSAFEGLRSYLDYLAAQAAVNADVAETLRARLRGFMQFWYRWAFFAATTHAAQLEVEQEISRLVPLVVALLGGDPGAYRAQVHRDLRGWAGRRRWYLWRLVKWLRTRFWDCGFLYAARAG
jgi:glycosyltransferase involved in cell wall biosynthesis